jgi:protein-disulfide isomerase
VATVLTPAEQVKVQALSKDPAIPAEVQRDVDAAVQAKVSSTPTFIITHRLQQRPWTFWDDNGALLRGYLNELLSK